MKWAEIESQELWEKGLPIVNEILPHCTAIGAYCVGLVHEKAVRAGLEAPRELLEEASRSKRVKEALLLYELWRATKG